MATFTFGPGPALDTTNTLVKNATGFLYEDLEATVPITDAVYAGTPVSSMTSDANGIIPQFSATLPKIYWVSGSITMVLESTGGLEAAAAASATAAEAAQSAAEAAQAAAESATGATWTTLAGKPSAFPPIVGTGPNEAFPGNGTMDTRYYTKSQADARYAPFGSGGAGDATIEGIPSLIRVEVAGEYPPRGTARTDLQIVWIGTTPPSSATAASGADFINEPIALSRGTGQGPDRFEAVS